MINCLCISKKEGFFRGIAAIDRYFLNGAYCEYSDWLI